MLQESVVTHRGCNEDLNSETFNSVELVFSKAVASIRTNDLNTLRDLLSAKVLSSAYLDTRDASSSTLLTLACQQGHTKAAKYLLRAGANLNANDDFGRTPIDAAVNEGHFDTADVLVKWAEKHGVQIGEQ
jgi:ankyrin repeat protein